MQNVTKEMKARGAQANPGETYYRMPSGHFFRVLGIRDEVSSQHGTDVLRMFATEVDLNGADVLRSCGAVAQDHHGHTITREAVAMVAFREHVRAQTEKYLARCVRASETHHELADFEDMFVPSSKAHYMPASLKHLVPKTA